MHSMPVRICSAVLLAILIPLTANGQTAAAKDKVAPESVLPPNSDLQFRYDGTAIHEAAWKKTAAYKSLITSEFYSELKGWAVKLGGDQPIVQPLERIADHLLTRGMMVGVSIQPGGETPDQTVATVLIDGAALQKDVEILLRQAGATIGPPAKKGMYTVSPLMLGPGSNNPSVNLVTFGPHLAVTSGNDAYFTATKNETPARIAASLKANSGNAEPIARTWVDAKQLIDSFGKIVMPKGPETANPQEFTVREFLSILGVEGLQQLVSESGFEGPACRNSTRLEFNGGRKGLLTVWSGPSFKIQDLPPLPESTPSFYAGSIDLAAVYDAVWEIVNNVADRVGPPDAKSNLEQGFAQFQSQLGFQVKDDFLAALGAKHVIYADSANAFAGIGAGLIVEVKDAAKLRRTIDTVLAMVPQGRGGPQIVRSKKYNRDLISIGQQGLPMWPTLCIDKDWLIVAMTPQMVESFLLRRDGKLDAWKPTDAVADALKTFPTDIVSLTVSDPRPMIVALGQYAPLLQSVLPPGVAPLELPPSDLMTKPLFPNVSVCTVKDGVIQWQSRDSLPSLPGVGSLSGPSVGSSAALVALLLPAVQQAREAARRTQSRNNLKQMGLALHNYHDTFNQFPTGTVVESAKEPEDRLSWLTAILPYVDQAPLYNRLDVKKHWDQQPQQDFIRIKIPTYLNPSLSIPPGFGDRGYTDYVGIAGLGADGPKKKPAEKGAGAFAYDHPRRIRDFTDGTSNTIIIGDVSGDRGPWAKGGKSTIRPLTVKPYIKGPDGFGGAHVGGAHFLFTDGSVRFVSENIDPNTMEALTTIAGGEVIGDF